MCIYGLSQLYLQICLLKLRLCSLTLLFGTCMGSLKDFQIYCTMSSKRRTPNMSQLFDYTLSEGEIAQIQTIPLIICYHLLP